MLVKKDLYSKPLIGILIFVNFFYFISCIYAVNSNDGSSLAAVLALVNKGSYVIDEYVGLTHNTDLTKYKGHYYTDRPPGTATLAAPFFYAGFKIGRHLKHIRKNDQLAIVFALFVPVIMGTLSVLLIFLFSRLLGISYWPSLIGSFFYAFSTLVWQKSTLLYTHVPTLFLILFAAVLAVLIKDIKYSKGNLIAIGFLCGISTFFEYNSVIPATVITLYLFCLKQPIKKTFSSNKKLTGLYIIAFLIGIAPLLIYNTVYFDNPFTTSYSYKLHFVFYKNISDIFQGNILIGLNDYFFRFDRFLKFRNETPGLLVLSPIFWFSFPGFFILYKKRYQEAILLLSIFFIPLGFLSLHPTPLVRYLTPYLPFLFIPGIAFLDSLWQKRSLYSKTIIILYFCAGLLSIRNIYNNNNHFWGHSPETPFIFFNNELSVWFMACLPVLFIFYSMLTYYFKKSKNR